MTIWFTSDQHFFHTNILTFKGNDGNLIRPGFGGVDEMNEYMVEAWNKVVRPEHHIYMLGDFTMERGSKGGPQAMRTIEMGRRLNGHKRIVLGNHDHFPVSVYVEAGFEKVRGCWGGFEGLVLTHIPVHPASLGRKMNVHGHIHERVVMKAEGGEGLCVSENGPTSLSQVEDARYLNVCVERWGYQPLSLDEIHALRDGDRGR